MSLRKLICGALFGVALPLFLALWARATEASVNLTVLKSVPIGVGLITFGFGLTVAGLITFRAHVGWSPMSALPPARFVAEGIYRLMPHPIYTGVVIVCAGAAVASGSASGLWLVTPLVALGCAALVWGHERHELRRRFGEAVKKPLLSLPGDTAARASVSERLGAYLLVFLPWLVLYQAVRVLGVPADAVVAFLPFERDWPVYEWTEVFYGSTYLFVGLVPLVAGTSRELRQFSISGLVAIGFVILMFLVVPLYAPPRPFEPTCWLGKLLAWERTKDTPAAAFPSFHVVWALLAARVYAARWPATRFLWWGYAVAIAVSCLTTAMHALVDVVAGVAVFLAVARIDKAWERVRGGAERLANSWREWRIGPLRVINHGAYAGAGAAAGLVLVITLAGPDNLWLVLLVAFCGLATSALWARFLADSSHLKRLFGEHGVAPGVVFGVVLAGLLGGDAWFIGAALCVGAPWGQAISKLRCLVNGCCHGRETSPHIGIRYTNPHTRVCRLPNLAGAPIHATAVYSILWNIVMGLLLGRLWIAGAPLTMVAGLYLILRGLGRFVEEAYRGEPQTPVIGGLRLHQWLAIVSVLAGVVVTTVRSAPASLSLDVNWTGLAATAGFGLATWFAVSVDFPQSKRRGARVT